MIDPGGIPQIDADLDAVAAAGASLRTEGGAVRDTGADVHATWQGLSAVYEAPEAGQLLAATAPVRTASDQVGSRLERVGAALVAYAEEVRPIQAELIRLRESAWAFTGLVEGVEDWDKDAGKVEEHNGLISAVASAKAAWEAAERTCANAISAVDGGVQFVADNGDGITQVGEYGYDAQTWQAAATSEDGAGWGTPEERDRPWYEDVQAFGKGVVDGAVGTVNSVGRGFFIDGAWGTVTALGTMVNPWAEDFGASWKGLGKVGLALVPGAIELNAHMSLFGVEQGELQGTLTQAAKGLVAWDMWSQDPARAAGSVGFNVLATIGTGGAGAAVTGTGKVATTARAAAASSRAAAAAGVARLPRLADVRAALAARVAQLQSIRVQVLTAQVAGPLGPNVPVGVAFSMADPPAGGGSAGKAANSTSGPADPSTASPAPPSVKKGPMTDAVPSNLNEQLALGAARAGAGDSIMRSTPLGDAPRLIANYGPGTWVKRHYVLRGYDTNVVVHYFHNEDTKMSVEFKCKH